MKFALALLALAMLAPFPPPQSTDNGQQPLPPGNKDMIVGRKNPELIPDSVSVRMWLLTARTAMDHDHLNDWVARPNGWQWEMSEPDQAALRGIIAQWVQDYKTSKAAYDALPEDEKIKQTKQYAHDVATRAMRVLQKDVPEQLSASGAAKFNESIEKNKSNISMGAGVKE